MVEVEDDLLRTLAMWSLASVAGGSALVGHGRHHGHPVITAFGRQTLAWGAINGTIAGIGWARRGKRDTADPEAHGTRLRRILRINSALDVGYIAVGGALIGARHRLASSPYALGRYSSGQVAADGAAVIVQGSFLLWLDGTFARRLEPHSVVQGRLAG